MRKILKLTFSPVTSNPETILGDLGAGGRIILNSPLINVVRCGQLAVDSLHYLEILTP